MEGKPSAVEYALRITFGIVHGVLLTLFSFVLVFMVPSMSQFLFGLYGCILAPAISLGLTLACNACIEYVAQAKVTVARVLQSCWIPPLGVFCISLLILPLEMMPSLGFHGPLNTLVATSILMNFAAVTLLQIYAARRIQEGNVDPYSSSEESAGASGPT